MLSSPDVLPGHDTTAHPPKGGPPTRASPPTQRGRVRIAHARTPDPPVRCPIGLQNAPALPWDYPTVGRPPALHPRVLRLWRFMAGLASGCPQVRSSSTEAASFRFVRLHLTYRDDMTDPLSDDPPAAPRFLAERSLAARARPALLRSHLVARLRQQAAPQAPNRMVDELKQKVREVPVLLVCRRQRRRRRAVNRPGRRAASRERASHRHGGGCPICTHGR